jgi:hypothetical protein
MVRSREGGWCLELGHLLIELMYGAVWEELGEEVQYQDSRFLVGAWHDSSVSTSIAGLVEQWVR